MKILTFSSLYPSAARPHFGVFVETRLRHLVAGADVDAVVVAPVPWFPLTGHRFGRWGAWARTPASETRHGIRVLHPRYPVLPKIGETVAPWLMAASLLHRLRALISSGFDFDLIDAHYFYPDGVAAAALARALGKPLVITARGSDLNVLGTHALPARMIRWAARRAFAVVTVSDALRRQGAALGIDPDKTFVLRNGVDPHLFRPGNRASQRAALGLTRPTLISVGNLVPLKGHDLVIEALARLPGVDLLIVGDGPEREALERQAGSRGLGERVRFLGAVPQTRLVDLYGAADVLVLASSREGWPNVLLEAMACGTPVAATAVGGCPEIVATPDAGVLVRERSAEAMADAIRGLLGSPPARAATRRHAERHGWAETTAGQLRLFEAAVVDRRSAGDAAVAPVRRDPA